MQEESDEPKKAQGVPAHGDAFDVEISFSETKGVSLKIGSKGRVARWLFFLGSSAALFVAYYIFF